MRPVQYSENNGGGKRPVTGFNQVTYEYLVEATKTFFQSQLE